MANRNEAYNPTVLRIDLDDGAVGVVGCEHRSIRRAQAHEPSANRGRLSHRSRVRVDAPDLASRVRDPDSLLPGRQRDGVPDGHLGRGCVRVRLDAQGPLGGRHHPECLLAECHAYRYMADVDDRGGLVRRRVDAEHMVRTRGDPDGIVIGVDRVGRVPDEFARAPQVDRLDDGVSAGIDARDCAVAPVRHPDRIGGDSEVYRRCSDSDRPDDFAAIRIDARDRSIVCVGDPDRAVPDRDGDRPSAHEHVAHDPGALRVDHSDRVGRNRRLSM